MDPQSFVLPFAEEDETFASGPEATVTDAKQATDTLMRPRVLTTGNKCECHGFCRAKNCVGPFPPPNLLQSEALTIGLRIVPQEYDTAHSLHQKMAMRPALVHHASTPSAVEHAPGPSPSRSCERPVLSARQTASRLNSVFVALPLYPSLSFNEPEQNRDISIILAAQDGSHVSLFVQLKAGGACLECE